MSGRYYGWIVAWTSCSVLAVTYGVQFSFGVLIPDIEAETGWSRTQVSLAYSSYVVLYSSLGFVTGTLTDRCGPRPVVAIGGVFLAIGYAGAGLASQLWHLYVALGVVAAVGMSASYVPCNATVVRWFVRRRGAALSIAAAGTGLGGLLLPPAAGLLSSAVGWRATYVSLAALCGLWLVGASRLLVRSPEDRGLAVDGDPPLGPPRRLDGPPTVRPEDHEPLGLDAHEAVRTPAFWLTAALFACTWVAVFFPLVHLAPFAESQGASRAVASLAVGAIGVGGLLGRLVTGSASDRIGRLRVLGIVIAVQAVAFVTFAVSHGPRTIFPAAVAFGFGYGGSTTLFPAVVGDLFGRTHAGSIVGLIFAGAGSLAAVGPALAGYLYDSTGSYRLSFVLSGGSNAVSLTLILALAAAMRALHTTAFTAPAEGR
jgi:MFS family permease